MLSLLQVGRLSINPVANRCFCTHHLFWFLVVARANCLIVIQCYVCFWQGTGGAAAYSSSQQESRSLMTEVSSSKTQGSGRGAKPSGFRFPSPGVAKQDTAPIGFQSRSRTASSQASSMTTSSSSRVGSSGDAEPDLMTPLATTRMEAVAVNAAERKAAAQLGGGEEEVQPEYELVYRGHMDLAQAWEGPGVEVASANLPKVTPLKHVRARILMAGCTKVVSVGHTGQALLQPECLQRSV